MTINFAEALKPMLDLRNLRAVTGVLARHRPRLGAGTVGYARRQHG